MTIDPSFSDNFNSFIALSPITSIGLLKSKILRILGESTLFHSLVKNISDHLGFQNPFNLSFEKVTPIFADILAIDPMPRLFVEMILKPIGGLGN